MEDGRRAEREMGVWNGLPTAVVITSTWPPGVYPMELWKSLKSKPDQA